MVPIREDQNKKKEVQQIGFLLLYFDTFQFWVNQYSIFINSIHSVKNMVKSVVYCLHLHIIANLFLMMSYFIILLLHGAAPLLWSPSKVIIEKSRGGRFLWNRN